MGVPVDEVLNELGWKDGFRIPVANEENKRLELEIENKSKRKARLVSEVERTEERLNAIEKHAANVEVEHDYNQKLITAHAVQLEAEDHLVRVRANALSGVNQSIQSLEKERKDVMERNYFLENELTGITNKIEESKKALEFDKIRLAELEENLNRKEETSQVIDVYMKDNAKEFKNYELERERLTKELKVHRQAVVRAVDQVHEIDIILDRTTKLYDETLRERSQLIDRWRQSVFVLKQRDNGIQETIREIDTLREVALHKAEVLQESENFLENQTTSNVQLEDNIKKLERKLASAKEERLGISREIEVYQLELKTRTKILEDLGRRTRQMRIDTKRKKATIGKKRKKAEDTKKQVEEVRATLRDIGNQSLNVADRLKQLEEMIEKEEKRKAIMAKETSKLQDLMLRTSKQISDLESDKKILELRKQGELKRAELLGAYEARDEKRLSEKKKIIYNLDMEIEKCKTRLERTTGTGGADKTEIDKKQKTIEDLERSLNDKIATSKLLQGQIANLEHDMRKVSNILARDSDELERLKNKKQDLCLSMEGGEKQRQAMLSRNKEWQVEETILNLRVFQAEKLLTSIGDKVYNLDKYRLQIEAAMKERNAEIRVYKETLNLRKRLALNECSEVRCAIAERKSRVQNLQTRYDLSIAAMGNASGSNAVGGTPITTAYLKIQSSQERYLLQERGDKLDATIRRTEHEIESMENTLRVVNTCNDKYKMSLGPVEEDGSEQKEKKMLDEEMYKVMETMRHRREQLERAKEDLEATENSLLISVKNAQMAQEEKDNKLWNVSNLERQINEQKERILRADKTLRKLFKDIQRICEATSDEMILLQEKDIATRELQEQNLVSLQRITEFTIRHVEVEAYVKKLLGSKGITLLCAQHLKPTPSPSRCDTTSEISVRTPSRVSVISTSRESIGRIHNIEARFSPEGVRSTRKNVSPAEQSTRSTARSHESRRVNAKNLSCRKK